MGASGNKRSIRGKKKKPFGRGAYHFYRAIFRVIQELVAAQKSSTGVVPLSQEGKALLLQREQQTQRELCDQLGPSGDMSGW